MPVFRVSNSAGQSVIVEASSKKAAIGHIAAKHYTAVAIRSSEILALVKSGATIESVPIVSRSKPQAVAAAA